MRIFVCGYKASYDLTTRMTLFRELFSPDDNVIFIIAINVIVYFIFFVHK